MSNVIQFPSMADRVSAVLKGESFTSPYLLQGLRSYEQALKDRRHISLDHILVEDLIRILKEK